VNRTSESHRSRQAAPIASAPIEDHEPSILAAQEGADRKASLPGSDHGDLEVRG
jgi:hypothetical protein